MRPGVKRALFYGVAALVIVLDRLSKAWAAGNLAGGRVVSVVPETLVLNLVHNRGSAFGLFQGSVIPLALVAALAVVMMVWAERRGLPGRILPLAIGLMLGGAVGNLIDRLHLGYVVDFIELDWHGRNVWPVFNLADSAITVGTVLLVLWLWKSETETKECRMQSDE